MLKRFTDLRFTIGLFLTLVACLVFFAYANELPAATEINVNLCGSVLLGLTGLALILSNVFQRRP